MNFEQNKGSLFCKYCKKSGHTIDKCYKLNGFSQHFKFTKGRKFGTAANAESSSSENPEFGPPCASTSPDSLVPGLTKEQYSQLMNLLQQSNLLASTTQPNLMGFANFVGSNLPLPKFNHVAYSACMLTSVAKSVWIVDSGATYHMTPDKELLIDITSFCPLLGYFA